MNYFLKQLFRALALLVYENSWVNVSLATALVLLISSGCTRDFGNSGGWWYVCKQRCVRVFVLLIAAAGHAGSYMLKLH